MTKLIGGYFSVDDLSECERLLNVLEQDCTNSKEKYDTGTSSYYVSNPQIIDTYDYGEGYDVHFTLCLFCEHEVDQDSPEISELSVEMYCGLTVY